MRKKFVLFFLSFLFAFSSFFLNLNTNRNIVYAATETNSSDVTILSNLLHNIESLLAEIKTVLTEISSKISGGNRQSNTSSQSEDNQDNPQEEQSNPQTESDGSGFWSEIKNAIEGSDQNQESSGSSNGGSSSSGSNNGSSTGNNSSENGTESAYDASGGKTSGNTGQANTGGSSDNQQPLPFQKVNQSPGSTSPGAGNNSSENSTYGDEDGTPKNPYHLEANQFKKICGQNKYVLWWSKRGTDGKDLKGVKDFNKGNPFLMLPACKELAKCHCCCNTCVTPESMCTQKDFCFSKDKICDDQPCSPNCKCPLCKSKCEQYTEPEHKKAFDTDCSCQQKGCPDSNSAGCKIILFKSESTWNYGRYEKGSLRLMNKVTQKGSSEITNDVPTDFWENGKDEAEGKKGWVDKLVGDKGRCCKCVPEEQAKEGPSGG